MNDKNLKPFEIVQDIDKYLTFQREVPK